MKTSDDGIRFIKGFEQLRLVPYKDIGGKWTIGYGHLIEADKSYSSLTPEEANILFLNDLYVRAEQPVSHSVMVSLGQNEFDALVSLCFNIGMGNFANSTLVKLLNAGATKERIAAEFGRWDHVNGKVSTGLVERRGAEGAMFMEGVYESHA